jgi:hypothetical protein
LKNTGFGNLWFWFKARDTELFVNILLCVIKERNQERDDYPLDRAVIFHLTLPFLDLRFVANYVLGADFAFIFRYLIVIILADISLFFIRIDDVSNATFYTTVAVEHKIKVK